MNLYWFSDEEGHFWQVIAAKSDDGAWEILSRKERENASPENIHEKYQLCAKTSMITDQEGVVAVVWPLEVNFSINDKPDGDLSMLSNY